MKEGAFSQVHATHCSVCNDEMMMMVMVMMIVVMMMLMMMVVSPPDTAQLPTKVKRVGNLGEP